MKYSSNAIVVFDKKILLFLRDNIPANDPNTWSLIGGEVEQGESDEDALKREMKEEIGIVAKDITFLGKVKLSEHSSAIYFVKLNKSEVGKISLGDEGREIRFFTHKEIKKLKPTENLAGYFDLYGQYIFEIIKVGKIPDSRKLGLK